MSTSTLLKAEYEYILTSTSKSMLTFFYDISISKYTVTFYESLSFTNIQTWYDSWYGHGRMPPWGCRDGKGVTL